MRLRVILLVAAVSAGAFMLGNGLATGAGDSTPASDAAACTLITKSEAEAALGAPVAVSDTGRACGFTVTERGTFMSLSAQIGPSGLTAANFAAAIAAYAESANATVRRVDGVGDEAWATLSPQISQVLARSGERFVSIVFVNVRTNADERVATMASLAGKALERVN